MDKLPRREDLMTTAEVADALRVSETTVKRWRARKYGPAPLQLGPQIYRYLRADVLAWVKTRKRRNPVE